MRKVIQFLILTIILTSCARSTPTTAPPALPQSSVAVAPATDTATPHLTTAPRILPTLTATPKITVSPTPPPSPIVPTKQVAASAPSFPTPSPILEPTIATQPESTPIAKSDAFPKLITEISLAPDDATLQDLLLDRANNRLYIADSTGQLHILDTTTYAKLATIPAAGYLKLDAAHNRLFVQPQYQHDTNQSTVVVDTKSLTVTAQIAPGGTVAIDPQRDRLYVGSFASYTTENEIPGVRVHDGTTLEQIAQITQSGVPVYNPLRDEILVVSRSVYIVNPETLETTGDLFPEITAQECPLCTGTTRATVVHVFPKHNLLMVGMTTLSTGGGPGSIRKPRFFNATTLEEIAAPIQSINIQRGCRSAPVLIAPVNGHTYRADKFTRYVTYNNLLVYDTEGTLQTWRDGLPLGIINPRTNQMYVQRDAKLVVLDLATLSPRGTIAGDCIHALDAENGLIYVVDRGTLRVYSERGGQSDFPPRIAIAALPAEPIGVVQLSPDYATNNTIFIGIGDLYHNKLYRSTDGGRNWSHLRGGLPEGEYLSLDFAISPNFARDQTLFAGGFRGEYWGEGIYRSTDRGDTWQPMWNDLTHLRVNEVTISPDYAADDTVLAYAQYQRLNPWNGGSSIFRSTDKGLSWSLVMTAAQGATPPRPENLWSTAALTPTEDFRVAKYGRELEHTTDGGKTWEPIIVTRQPDFNIRAILKSPKSDAIYVISDYDLFRSIDDGETWQRWIDARLAGRDFSQRLMSGAISPTLPNGGYQLFIGTAGGEFWALDPAVLDWQTVHIAPRWDTVLAGEWIGEIEIAPNGDVWLGTWGSGLARCADGEIKNHYTVSDGLPSDFIGGIAVAPDDTIWVGTDLPPNVASFDGQTWTNHPLPFDVGGVLDVTIDANGAVWVGAQAFGIFKWNGASWDKITDREERMGWRTDEIEIDADGALWCATTSGAAHYDGNEVTVYSVGESQAVEFGRDGAGYLLRDSDILRRVDNQWTALPSPVEGLLNSRALYVAADGAVWLGTIEGIFRYNGETWQQFTAQDGLPDNEVVAIAKDADGWLWFGTKNGAARVNPETLNLKPVSWMILPTPVFAPTTAPLPKPEHCELSPAGVFTPIYAKDGVAVKLQCPVAEAFSTWAAYQPFERGMMFWRADTQTIDVLCEDGRWERYDDTWDESQPENDPALKSPEGLWQPVRGFGKVWRAQLGGAQAKIGWARVPERGYHMLVQSFGGGGMFTGIEGKEIFVLYTDRTWESWDMK